MFVSSKANNFSLEKRHLQVKSRLESLLHLNLPFSTESTQVVETLLDNLIKASELYESMKHQNQEILSKLKESESSFGLMKGVNSRLVEEINELNYAMMRLKEDTESIQYASKTKIEQLEQAASDYKCVLEEKQRILFQTEEQNSELKLKLDSFLFPNNVQKERVEGKDCENEVMRIYDTRIEQLQRELQGFVENKQLLLEKIKQMSIQIQNREKEVIRMQDLMKKTSEKVVNKKVEDHKESLYSEKLLSSERKIDFLNNENQKLELELQKLKGYKIYELCQMVEEYKEILAEKDRVIGDLEMQFRDKVAEVQRLNSEAEMKQRERMNNKIELLSGSEDNSGGSNQMNSDYGLRIQQLQDSHEKEITQLQLKIKQLKEDIILEKEQSYHQSQDSNYQKQLDAFNEQLKGKEEERLDLEENVKGLKDKVEELEVKLKEAQTKGNILQGKLTQQIRRNELADAEKEQQISLVSSLKKQIEEQKEQFEKQKEIKKCQGCCQTEAEGERDCHKKPLDQELLLGQLKEFQDHVAEQKSVIEELSAELKQWKKSNQKLQAQHEQFSREEDQVTKGIYNLEEMIKVRDSIIKEQEQILKESQSKLAAAKQQVWELYNIHEEEQENSDSKVINLEEQYAGRERKLQEEFHIMQQKHDAVAQTWKTDKELFEQRIASLVQENKKLEKEMQQVQKDRMNLEEQLQRYQMERYLERESSQQELDNLNQQIKNHYQEEQSKDNENSQKIYQLDRQLRQAVESVAQHKDEIERLNEQLIRSQEQLMKREDEDDEEKEVNYAKQQIELELAFQKIKELENQLDETTKLEVESKNQKKNQAIVNENLENELNRVNLVNFQLNIEIKEMKEQLHDFNSQVKKLKDSLVEAREQTSELNQQLLLAMKQASSAKDQLQQKEAEFKATTYQNNLILETEKQQFQYLQEQLDHSTINLTKRIAELNTELNETKDKSQLYQVASETAQNELAKEKKENNKKATSLSELITERDQLRKQVKKEQQDINILTDQQLDLQSEIKVLQNQCEEFRKENKSQETECERLTSQCYALRRQVLEKDSNISVLTQKLESK